MLQILRVYAVIHPQGPAKGSKEHPFLLPILRVPLNLLDHMALMTEQCAQQPGPEEPFLVLGITQKEHLFGLLVK